MTREELQKLVDDNPWYNGMACGIGLRRILTHDAEQRAEIARLREALEFIASQDKPGNWAVEIAKQALKETIT